MYISVNMAANMIYPVLAISAMWLISQKKRAGFIIFLFVEALVLFIGISSKQYGLAGMTFIYAGMYIYSFKKWGPTK